MCFQIRECNCRSCRFLAVLVPRTYMKVRYSDLINVHFYQCKLKLIYIGKNRHKANFLIRMHKSHTIDLCKVFYFINDTIDLSCTYLH